MLVVVPGPLPLIEAIEDTIDCGNVFSITLKLRIESAAGKLSKLVVPPDGCYAEVNAFNFWLILVADTPKEPFYGLLKFICFLRTWKVGLLAIDRLLFL